MRILIGPVEVSGVAAGLSQGLREQGEDAQVVLSCKHPFSYGGDVEGVLFSIWRFFGGLRSTPHQHILRKVMTVLLHRCWSFLVLVRVLFSYDAFIFLYGQSLTDTRFELWLLRLLGKKIIFIFVGSDSRPPYMDGGICAGDGDGGISDPRVLSRLCRKSKLRIRRIEKYADFVINSPAAAHFHERRYINWFEMGLPRSFDFGGGVANPASEAVRIVHAPSNPQVKGSYKIEAIIGRLRDKGYLIDFVQIRNLPNARVLEELRRCDFVVDQLYSDSPMAAFAAEAACFGKPSVVGGYFASKVGRFVSDESLPPSLFVEPDEVESAIERLVTDTFLRRELGERARRFVQEKWCLTSVARRYLELLNGKSDARWWCDPQEVEYFEGCGLSRERVKGLMSSLVASEGMGALLLSDKPRLEQAIRAFLSASSGEHGSRQQYDSGQSS